MSKMPHPPAGKGGIAALLLGSALVSGASFPAMAQQGNAPLLLDTVIITANRGERPASAVPGAVQVIGQDVIAEQLAQSNDATSLLARLVPGFTFSNQTLSGASETFRGRGVLIMVDGVPRNTPLRDASRTLSLIDLANVERVEVIGGASSLYGAGGTGGVVNFITKSGADADGKARITMDTRMRAFTADVGASIVPEMSIGVTQKLGAFDYALGLSLKKSRVTFDGAGRELPSDPMLGQGGGDRTGTLNGSLRLGYDIGDGKRVEMSFEHVDMEQNPAFFTNYLTDPVSPDTSAPYYGLPVTEDSSFATLSFTDENFALGKLTVALSANDVNKRFAFNIYDPVVNSIVYYSGDPLNPTADFNQSELESRRDTLAVGIDSPLTLLGREANLSWGIETGRDATRQTGIDGNAIATPLNNRWKSAYAQLTLPVNDALTLSGGLRYDHFDLSVGGFTRPAAYYMGYVLPAITVTGGEFAFEEVTGNLGATFDLAAGTQVFGGWSQGYSLTDIGSFTRRAGLNSRAEACSAYGTNVPVVAFLYRCTLPGSGTLSYAEIAPKPQVVDTYEIGLRHDGATWGGQVSAFYSTSDEGVNFDPATNRVRQAHEEIWGAEAQGTFALSDSTVLDAMLAFREGRVDSNGDGDADAWMGNNRIASPLRVRLGISHEFAGGLMLRGEAVHLSGRDKVPTEVQLEGVTLVNAQLAAPVGPGMLSLSVENLFDRDYVNPTTTATRNTHATGWGRIVTIGYNLTF